MARQQRDARLQTRESRRKLPASHEPFWHEVRRGLHLGYRKGLSGGVWWIREYQVGRYLKRRLGVADDDIEADGVTVLSWSEALKQAIGEERPTVTAPEPTFTLNQALEDYFAHRRAKSPFGSVETDRAKAKAFIPSRLARRALAEITTVELLRWRDGLVIATDDREKLRCAQATANRSWSILRAALNHAYASGKVLSDHPWRRIKPFRNVDRPRTRFLSVEEAKRLLNASLPDFRDIARGALYTGLRLGELVELRVMDVADGQVHVRHSKSGRPRSVPLSDEGLQFFDQITAGRAGDDSVFQRQDGEGWIRMDASRYMARASEAAKIKPPARFHDLRRSYASLLINRGTDAEIIRELLGHADLRMTLRAYAHLLNRTVARVVRKKLPSFGFEPSNVRKLKRA
ncbi:MAG TPA: site-specific integrase [Steroidobacteraceae bacterium]|jgi:integrase